MVKKFLTIMFASVMAMLAFTACSNDDRKSWDGKNTVITIPDGCGSISLADDSNNGAYYLLSFRDVG